MQQLDECALSKGLSSIGQFAFSNCSGLERIVIPDNVTSIGDLAFSGCTALDGTYFQGDAPAAGFGVFDSPGPTTVYYLAGNTGFNANYAGRPTAIWVLQPTIISSFAISENQFGFTISGTADQTVVWRRKPISTIRCGPCWKQSPWSAAPLTSAIQTG